jgi:thiol-disulfide isomerase/thioredoxin
VTNAGKSVKSIALILGLAAAALAGLLLIMGQLAAAPATIANTATPTLPVDTPAAPPETALPDTVAVVAPPDCAACRTIITRPAWDIAARLDAAMSFLAGQPMPPAEETLDRLVNEILVLAAVPDAPPPAPAQVEQRLADLTAGWGVTPNQLDQTLQKNNLTRADLTTRTARLLQVETALTRLAGQQPNLAAWLSQTRAAAEISLYKALTAAPVTPQTPVSQPLTVTPAVAEPQPAPPPNLPIGPHPQNLAPDFDLPALTGPAISLSQFSGKPVLINFWASWCPPCRSELPALQAAFEQYGHQIGFIAVDVKESPETVAAFVQEMGLTFPVALDTAGQVSNELYQVRGIPTTIFVDAQGVVSARHVGPLDSAAIEGYLVPLLAQSTRPPLPENGQDAFQVAPAFTLSDATGKSVSLADYRDQSRVVLVFNRGQT